MTDLCYYCLIFMAFLKKSVTGFELAGPKEIVEILTNGSYEKNLTPTHFQGRSTDVYIGMFIEGMSSIRVQTMDFQLDIYFDQFWVDRRLAHNSDKRVLIKDLNILQKMWRPDLYFANANSAKFFDVTEPNFFMWVFPNGTIHHEFRCDLRILSYAYTMDHVTVNWRGGNTIQKNVKLRLPDMQLIDVLPGFCDGEYLYGNWSCVRAIFLLSRQSIHHVLQNYVPTTIIVVISWFSFWLDIDSVPGRVSLCITTVLTLATQASSTQSTSLPQVSCAKAIDIWLEACLAFVFGVLIEFTAVNYLARRADAPTTRDMSLAKRLKIFRLRKRQQMETINLCDQKSAEQEDTSRKKQNDPIDIRVRRKNNRAMAYRIDRVCRIAFPTTFAFFNLMYWTYYLVLT